MLGRCLAQAAAQISVIPAKAGIQNLQSDAVAAQTSVILAHAGIQNLQSNAVAAQTPVILAHAGIQNLQSNAVVEVFITACAERSCFAPYARVTFVIATKVTKNASPYLGPTLRYGFPRSVAAPGAGETGHPWPDTPFAAPGRSTPYASTPLGLR